MVAIVTVPSASVSVQGALMVLAPRLMASYALQISKLLGYVVDANAVVHGKGNVADTVTVLGQVPVH